MTEFFANILIAINSVVGNYGWALVVFTLLFRLIVTPLDFKSRKSMRKTTQIQPKIAALQKKYANDQQKMQQKMSELYKKEGINPLSGCVPMLLSLPLLWLMFGAMRYIANIELAKQAFAYLSNEAPTFEHFLWIKNLWMPDSPFAALAPNASSLQMIPADIWQKVYAGLSEVELAELPQTITYLFGASDYKATVDAMLQTMQTVPAYMQAMEAVPGWSNLNVLFFNFSIYKEFNGLFILPVIAAVSQFMMTKVTASQQTMQAGDNQQASTMNAVMKWFFPIFSLWICSGYNAGFAVYWVVANLFAIVQTVLINKVLDKQEAQAKIAAGEGDVK